jgi:hypothetical protein
MAFLPIPCCIILSILVTTIHEVVVGSYYHVQTIINVRNIFFGNEISFFGNTLQDLYNDLKRAKFGQC